MQYAAGSLRPTSVVLPTGATTNYAYDDTALSVTTTTCSAACGAAARIAGQSVARMNGAGLVRRQETLADGGQWDIVETQYDPLQRVWQQTPPFLSVQTPLWNVFTYDALGRVTLVHSADGSETRHVYNESTQLSLMTAPGQNERVVNAWGQEPWLLRNALGQLALVVDPDPATGLVKDPGAALATYSYNTTSVPTFVGR
jgi:YD repeat-containing protein